VLDEPTASLPADEVERLFDAVRRLRSRDVGMIYVSHRLDEIFRIADRVVVMRDGRLVGEKPTNETTPDELVSLIVRPLDVGIVPQGRQRPGTGSRRRAGVATPGAGPVDFDIREGELLGLVGLRGAGQEEIAAPCSAPSLTPARCLSMRGSRTFLRRVRRCARASAFWRRDRAEEVPSAPH